MRRLHAALIAGAMALALPMSEAGAIVGGVPETGPLAPFVVMLLQRQGATAGFCSAVVVAPDAVLTAAHCVPQGAALKVHYRDGAGAPVLADIRTVARHPGFRADAIRSRQRSIDLALVRLAAPLPGRFRAAPLGTIAATAVGTAFRLAGFGLAREGAAETSGVLRIADVAARAPLSGLLLWANDPTGHGLGACTGDSGGPVFSADGAEVVGVIAWSAGAGGAQCGDLTQAVWIGPQRGWIEGVLAGWGAR